MTEDEVLDQAAVGAVVMGRLGHRPETLWALDGASVVVMCLTCRELVRWWRRPSGWYSEGIGTVGVEPCVGMARPGGCVPRSGGPEA